MTTLNPPFLFLRLSHQLLSFLETSHSWPQEDLASYLLASLKPYHANHYALLEKQGSFLIKGEKDSAFLKTVTDEEVTMILDSQQATTASDPVKTTLREKTAILVWPHYFTHPLPEGRFWHTFSHPVTFRSRTYASTLIPSTPYLS